MINIAEKLKNAPKGLKLYCTIFGECELEDVNSETIVLIFIKSDIRTSFTLDKYGRYSECGDCVLFPDKDWKNWEDWQHALFSNNKGVVLVDKVTGYSYLVVDKEGFRFALCDIFGNISTIINVPYLIFADNDTAFSFFEQLESNDYEYKNGKIVPIEKKCEPQKVSRNDYKKIIEHYGIRNQLKKLSEEVYELQEAVIDLQDFNAFECKDEQLTQDVIEEIADVFVILRQLVMQFDISQNDIEDMADYKVKRTLERIEKEK
jgi:NTP pyrophosphatase (non-canonical NTP hydrolase)